MRFLLRSVFWLVVAFLVIRPGIDLNAAAGSLTHQAVAAGQQVIGEQLDKTQCDTLQCAGGKALLAAALISPTGSAAAPRQAVAEQPIPFPRPRPDWLG